VAITLDTGSVRLSQYKTTQLLDAAEFFALTLMGPRLTPNVTIDIELDPEMDVGGECVNEDCTKRSRWFTIRLNPSNNFYDILQTLAHEMVHVKQQARNELRRYDVPCARGGKRDREEVVEWQGSIWTPGKHEDPYWDAPWEVDAYGREVGLVNRFMQSYRKSPESKIVFHEIDVLCG
jgi:hypothetical protein